MTNQYNEILEYQGKRGQKIVTDVFMYPKRMHTPQAGDPVSFSLMNGKYPFDTEGLGRIDGIGKWNGDDADDAHICIKGASVFACSHDSVSISGGPFCMVKAARLRPTGRSVMVRFWNWGDNLPGANQGVEYMALRPLFELLPEGGLNDDR